MAGETVGDGAVESWGAGALGLAKSLLTPQRLAVLLALGFFGLAFVAYYLSSPGPTGFNNFVLLADAFLQGRLDLGRDITYLELAVKDGKFYVIPPPMPAIVVLPGVALVGTAVSQTFVSFVIGGLNASVVHGLVRGLKQKLTAQVWLTILFVFGTMYWYVASNGGVWFFSHTLAVLFLFLAVYATLVRRNPFLAGLFLGAAYLSRLTTILSLPFFIIMFSDQWLRQSPNGSLLKRVDIRPLLQLGLGLGIFVLLNFTYNYLRFDTPLDASYYFRKPEIFAEPWHNHGPFHISYIPRHIPVIFRALPLFQSDPPFVLAPNFSGVAIWATTPAFFYALFAAIRNRLIIGGASGLMLITATLFVLSARGMPLDLDPPYGLEFAPFYLVIALAIAAGIKNRDKLTLACWSAIIPIAMTDFSFAGTGWAQFGYRFALDFYPFLFLLTMKGMGPDIRWHHKLLIGTSVIINLWAVLSIYQFGPSQFLDLTWTTW